MKENKKKYNSPRGGTLAVESTTPLLMGSELPVDDEERVDQKAKNGYFFFDEEE